MREAPPQVPDEASPDDSATIFCQHCANGRLSEVQEHLQEERELLQCLDPSGYSPLHWASLYNQVAVMRYLLQEGADPLFAGAHGDLPIHWATKKSCEQALDLLVCHLRSLPPPTDISKGETKEESSTPWYLSIRDDAGLTPFHHAAECGNTVAMHYFLCLGQDINEHDDHQRTPLHWATHTGSIPSVRYLINRSRCDLNHADDNGTTALHWCAKKNHIDVARMILEAGASPHVKNNEGETPLDIAVNLKHK